MRHIGFIDLNEKGKELNVMETKELAGSYDRYKYHDGVVYVDNTACYDNAETAKSMLEALDKILCELTGTLTDIKNAVAGPDDKLANNDMPKALGGDCLLASIDRLRDEARYCLEVSQRIRGSIY